MPEEQKGFLTEEQEKELSNIIDDVIDAKGIVELVDGYAARVFISQLDDRLLSRINLGEDLKQDIGKIIQAGIEKDLQKVEDLSGELLNKLVNIPGLDEDAELLIFQGTIKSIIGYIKLKLRKEAA